MSRGACGRRLVTCQRSVDLREFPRAPSSAPATISGPHTALNGPAAATVTSAGDVWVANASNNSLTEYAPAPTETPRRSRRWRARPRSWTCPRRSGRTRRATCWSRTCSASPSGASRRPPTATSRPAPRSRASTRRSTSPTGVDVDAQGRIYVANQFDNSISVFAPDASSDAVPVGTIAGGATGLSGPGAIAVAPPLSIQTTTCPTRAWGTSTTAPSRPRWEQPPTDDS